MRQVLILFMIFTFVSCSKDMTDTTVNIRLKNVSDLMFESATYNFIHYGELNSDQFTEYKQFESSYRYGSFEVIINGQDYYITPIDYVGEELLETGDYTFELDIDQNELRYELVKD